MKKVLCSIIMLVTILVGTTALPNARAAQLLTYIRKACQHECLRNHAAEVCQRNIAELAQMHSGDKYAQLNRRGEEIVVLVLGKRARIKHFDIMARSCRMTTINTTPRIKFIY